MTFFFIILYHLKSTLVESTFMHTIIKRRGQICNTGVIEMKAKTNVTTSEVTMSPQHVKKNEKLLVASDKQDGDIKLSLSGMNDDLREPLL